MRAVMRCSVSLTFLQTGVVFVRGGTGKGFPSLPQLLCRKSTADSEI